MTMDYNELAYWIAYYKEIEDGRSKHNGRT